MDTVKSARKLTRYAKFYGSGRWTLDEARAVQDLLMSTTLHRSLGTKVVRKLQHAIEYGEQAAKGLDERRERERVRREAEQARRAEMDRERAEEARSTEAQAGLIHMTCQDCGLNGERTGHQTCAFPSGVVHG